ncbi:hypothetical protein G0D98_19515 [Pseudomonas savastanoi pv. phaseolicola]|uniref:hypothetical protein n=1 Tax=Pseudomonas savastanoi TaxID=29438 RepID=UPI0005782AE4|nr:hypothetical protein [Pseudomonas savastanoi]MBN3470654.1 hypothetical protein [Pseudomonas savastanoi pv. phaseolicola]MBN3477680.1 hypothetical protein [Pseudomonas savastanoi pv. phaseolicola]
MQDYDRRGSTDPKAWIGLVVLVGLVGYAIFSEIGKWIGVDAHAAFTLVIGIVVFIVLLAVGFWSQTTGATILTVENVMPFALFLLIAGLSPALSQLACVGLIDRCYEVKVWGNSRIHFGFAATILFGGYVYLYLRRY